MKSIFSNKHAQILITTTCLLFVLSCSSKQNVESNSTATLSASEKLGKALFFDASLSSPQGQSCASCHSPKHGFSHPDNKLATAEGAMKGLFGNRNVPSIAYIGFTPNFHKVIEEGDLLYVGGFFLDGREATLEDQATKPMLNPVEMGIKDEATLVAKIKTAGYEAEFNAIYGKGALSNTKQAIKYISNALADFERSKEFSPFDSKYDAYLAGKVQLTEKELKGLKLFEAEDKGNCAACHPSTIDKETGFPPLFTDYTYDNLGVASNEDNPFFKNPTTYNPHGKNYSDKGLGEAINDKNQNGKFKVPTLRNIALTAPYMHNGVLENLTEVVKFYNTRDTNSNWGIAEVTKNVNKDELGDLKLTDDEIEAIVAFLNTLSDGYEVKQQLASQ